MAIIATGIDLAKNVFAVHGVNLGGAPPRQNTCHPDRTDEQGAEMRERLGKIRTGIQEQSGGEVVAAGERGVGRRGA